MEPYSPIALEKDNVNPVNNEGNKVGKIILEKVRQGEAPNIQAAC